MGKSIDELLSEEQPEAAVEPATEETQAPEAEVSESVEEEPSGPIRDEKGRFAPKETGVEQAAEPEPVPPTEPSNQLPQAEYAALRDERRKRQEAEARAQALEEHYARLAQQAQPQQPQAQPTDFWDDPQSFMDQRMSQLGESLLQQWEQRQQAQRLDASEQNARARHADYDEAFQAFEQAVQLNPRLAVELAQAPDPGEFAYQRGKTARAIQSVGSIDDLKAQLRAELEAEARAAIPQPRISLPSTTAVDGSVGGRTGPEWSGPKPLGSILG